MVELSLSVMMQKGELRDMYTLIVILMLNMNLMMMNSQLSMDTLMEAVTTQLREMIMVTVFQMAMIVALPLKLLPQALKFLPQAQRTLMVVSASRKEGGVTPG